MQPRSAPDPSLEEELEAAEVELAAVRAENERLGARLRIEAVPHESEPVAGARRATAEAPSTPYRSEDRDIVLQKALEKAADLLFATSTTPAPAPSGSPSEPAKAIHRGWAMVEVQNRKDERKAKSWHLSTSVLLQESGMGDLIVITASRSVARWAKEVAHHRGALGTTKGLTPVVLYLSKKIAAQLLDPAVPQLALFAVWAQGRGSGRAAKEIVERAVEVTEALPPELQEAQTRAILAMLSKRLLDHLKEIAVDVSQIKETKASRAFRMFFENRGREQGLAEGTALGREQAFVDARRDALLALLKARGFVPSEQEHEQIAALKDLDQLDACIQSATKAATVADALAAARKRAPRAGRKTNGHKKINGHHG